MFYSALNAPLMLTVARYFENISNKIKFLLSLLAKKTQPIFILSNGSTDKMNDGPNEKMSLWLKNQTKKITAVK